MALVSRLLLSTRLLWLALPLLGTILASSVIAQANSMKCDTKLVREGDSTYQVKSICGAPDAATQRTEKRSVRHVVQLPCGNGGRCATVVEDVVEVLIDEWTYDFGPQRFIQYLIFEQGKLVKVVSGGYGHKQT